MVTRLEWMAAWFISSIMASREKPRKVLWYGKFIWNYFICQYHGMLQAVIEIRNKLFRSLFTKCVHFHLGPWADTGVLQLNTKNDSCHISLKPIYGHGHSAIWHLTWYDWYDVPPCFDVIYGFAGGLSRSIPQVHGIIIIFRKHNAILQGILHLYLYVVGQTYFDIYI